MACPSLQTIIEDITCNTDKSRDEQAVVMSMAAFSFGSINYEPHMFVNLYNTSKIHGSKLTDLKKCASGGLGFYALIGRKFPSILRHGLGIPLAFGGVAAMGTYLAANDVTPNDIRRAYFRLKT